jgi:hypothetical protein
MLLAATAVLAALAATDKPVPKDYFLSPFSFFFFYFRSYSVNVLAISDIIIAR